MYRLHGFAPGTRAVATIPEDTRRRLLEHGKAGAGFLIESAPFCAARTTCAVIPIAPTCRIPQPQRREI